MSKVKSYKELIPQSLLYYVAIMPRRAAETARGGQIVFTQETRETEEFTNLVGEVVDIGALALKAKTPGLDYADDVNKPKIGDWVVYGKHAGIKLQFLLDTEAPLIDPANRVSIILLSDTDLFAKLTPTQVEHLTGWST